MNQPAGGGPPHGVPQGGVTPQYVDDPVPQRSAAGPYAQAPHYAYWAQQGRSGPNGQWVACPRCRSPYVNKPTFTWWGGLVGPLIIPEVKCATCGNSYNGKTGGPLGLSIALYLAVVLGFIFAVFGVAVYVIVSTS